MRKSARQPKPFKRYGQDEDEEQASALTPKTKTEWLEAAKRLRAKKPLGDTAAAAESTPDEGTDNVDPSDSASQVSDASTSVSESESTVLRRLELRRKQAKLLQELKEQEDQQQIELQELKLA